MRALATLLFVITLFSAQSVLAESEKILSHPLKFEDYPATVYGGDISPLEWTFDNAPAWIAESTTEELLDYFIAASKFKDDSYDGMARNLKLRLGGNYLLVYDRCGAGCQLGLIIDVRTGMPVDYLPSALAGYAIQANSNLLVVNPLDEDAPRGLDGLDRTSYYKWEDGKWILLGEYIWP